MQKGADARGNISGRASDTLRLTDAQKTRRASGRRLGPYAPAGKSCVTYAAWVESTGSVTVKGQR